MPATTDLILSARQKSNTERSKFVSDTEVLGYLNERLQSLRDRMIEADPSYYHAQADLTFDNPAGHPLGSATLPDLYRIRGVTQWPDTPNARPIRPLAFSARDGRREVGYVLDGTCLSIVPYQEATRGPARLYFTPPLVPLGIAQTVTADVLPVTVPVVSGHTGLTPGLAFVANDLDPADIFIATDVGNTLRIAGATTPGNNGDHIIGGVSSGNQVTFSDTTGMGSETFPDSATVSLLRASRVDGAGNWVLYGNSFTSANVTAVLTVSGSQHNDGQFTVTSAPDGTTLVTSGTTVAENFGPNVTMTLQPAGTVPTLDTIMVPFQAYLTIGAALSIATKMQKTDLVALLTQQFAAEEARVDQIATNRAGETEAIPVLWSPHPTAYNPWGWGWE